jgi:hypothetical protein
MNSGRYILTQVLDIIHWQTLSRLAARYNIRARHFPKPKGSPSQRGQAYNLNIAAPARR